MCLAIEGIRAEGREEGLEEGETKGILKILHTLVEKGLISIATAAEYANASVDGFLDAVESLND